MSNDADPKLMIKTEAARMATLAGITRESERRILLLMADRWVNHKTREVFVFIKTIMETTGYGERTVQEARATLVAAGILELIERGGGAPQKKPRRRKQERRLRSSTYRLRTFAELQEFRNGANGAMAETVSPDRTVSLRVSPDDVRTVSLRVGHETKNGANGAEPVAPFLADHRTVSGQNQADHRTVMAEKQADHRTVMGQKQAADRTVSLRENEASCQRTPAPNPELRYPELTLNPEYEKETLRCFLPVHSASLRDTPLGSPAKPSPEDDQRHWSWCRIGGCSGARPFWQVPFERTVITGEMLAVGPSTDPDSVPTPLHPICHLFEIAFGWWPNLGDQSPADLADRITAAQQITTLGRARAEDALCVGVLAGVWSGDSRLDNVLRAAWTAANQPVNWAGIDLAAYFRDHLGPVTYDDPTGPVDPIEHLLAEAVKQVDAWRRLRRWQREPLSLRDLVTMPTTCEPAPDETTAEQTDTIQHQPQIPVR